MCIQRTAPCQPGRMYSPASQPACMASAVGSVRCCTGGAWRGSCDVLCCVAATARVHAQTGAAMQRAQPCRTQPCKAAALAACPPCFSGVAALQCTRGSPVSSGVLVRPSRPAARPACCAPPQAAAPTPPVFPPPGAPPPSEPPHAPPGCAVPYGRPTARPAAWRRLTSTCSWWSSR